ncbi:sensor histidine kinase [Herbiconiux sp. P18]|uniref:sensor histidine kinase n=1 Tax=Herbiconiux liangxiaofengii TaxID=3342795 RepID=UPI0035BAAF47
MALIELVKNSFDADASAVLVRFVGNPIAGEGSVEIWDDGHGMGADTLQTSWLDIATDAKKKRATSESGKRRVLGEKGIGRLAAGRLGDELLLTTRRRNESEIQLLIDWTAFDREDAYLDEIEVAWAESTGEIFGQVGAASGAFEGAGAEEWQSGQGTLLRIDKLTRTWVRDDFLSLHTALGRLIRPRPSAKKPSDFRIFVSLPAEFEALAGEVQPPQELRQAHYKLFGHVDASGLAQLTYEQFEPRIRETLPNEQLWNRDVRAPTAGPFDLDIEVWDRDKEAIQRVAGDRPVRDFRRLLDQVAGVSVYRDGFRVLPFGEQGDDWLQLDRRRIQNPTVRVSNNQVIGHVFIGADTNTGLRDQSNREGLLDGPPYEDLKAMVQSALTAVESRRYTARRPAIARERPRDGLFRRFELGEIREVLSDAYPNDTRLLGMIDQKNRDIQEGVEEVQQVLSQYSRLATLGSLIDRVLHDGRTSVTRLKNIARFGQRDLKKAFSTTDKLSIATESLVETDTQADVLATLFNQIEPFGGRKRGRPKLISVHSIFRSAISIVQADADEKAIELRLSGDDVETSVDSSEILTVLVNLIQNATYWVSTVPRTERRIIEISAVRNDDESLSLLVSDSGPGVPDSLREAIFDPYFSTRPDGVGLGLSIAGNLVHELYGGQLSLLESGPLPGATFEALLRKRV